MNTLIEPYLKALHGCETIRRVGKVTQFFGAILESQGPDVYLGELCEITTISRSEPILAEVVGFRDGRVLMVPYGNLHGVQVNSEIVALGISASISVPAEIRSGVIDCFGNSLLGEQMSGPSIEIPLYTDPSNPLDRAPIKEIFQTGVSCLDNFLTVGRGQRLGIFAGSGVGKSTLLGMIAANSKADINIIALIGERGREVLDFIESDLGVKGLKNSIVVVAAADQPAMIRSRAAFVATALAEHFSNLGMHVMLAMDSVTRFAMALRELGLAIGELPASRGYPPSTFSVLPKLLERSGNFKGGGSITSFYTVLVEGDDFNEPVSDNVRAILDGHLILTRELAQQGKFPAVDFLKSVSRLQNSILDKDQKKLISDIRYYMGLLAQNQDMIAIGAYQEGRNPELDFALKIVPKIEKFLFQTPADNRDIARVFTELNKILMTQKQNAERK